ncbi:membrane protein insertase YidC [uncultured Dokdonia sp.]|uniref:membrane protein insertase YidC n=1 Tax=uncultured Dokdonia sp. TaxID=575653 RepID=UPI002632F79E|nr:membrane protein insertase YidC [uncultured Dokdonia sp.]
MKKFDRTSVIGMLLMGAIILYIMYTRPTPEEIQAQEEAKQEQVQEKETPEASTIATPEFTNTVASTDSIGRSQLQNRLGAFAYSGTLPSAREDVTVLKNDVLELEISNKGGHIVKATLLQHKTFDSIPVYLIKDGNSQFNISFSTTDNRNLNTKDLFFEPVLSKNGDNEVLTMRLKVSPTEYLEYRYELKQGDYMLDFGLKSQGLARVFNTGQPMRLQWDFQGMRHAKSIEYENRYTRLTYEYDGGKTDKLGQAGDDDEIVSDLSWMNYRQHFFSSMLLTDTPFKEAKLYSNDLLKNATDADQETEFTKEYKADLLLTPRNGELDYAMNMYYGPTDYKILKEYDRNLGEAMPLGWGIFGFLNKYLVIPFFGFLTGFLPAGIAIILMTIAIKLILSPVQYKQYVSQAKMKVLKPEIAAISEKYKDNAMKKQKETMALYSKAGASPAAGCLPALLQIPVFYALFTFFPSAFGLRGESFLWASDLSSYDEIAKLPFKIPFYGDHISLFPILAAVTIFFSMRLTTGNQAMQQPTQEGMPDMGKMMKYMMYFSPLLMLFFFNNYASGLSLYYFISNLITIGIILVIKKYIIDEDKIKAKIEVKKAKPKKQGRFQKKMAEIMEQAEKQKNAKGK